MGAIDMTNPNVHHRKQRNNSHNRPSSAERNKQRAMRGMVNPAPRAAVRPSLLRLRKLFNFCKALSNFRAALHFREEEVQSGRCWLDEEIENQPAPTNAAAAENSAATHQQLKRQQHSQKKEKKGGKGGQPRIYPVYRAPAMPQQQHTPIEAQPSQQSGHLSLCRCSSLTPLSLAAYRQKAQELGL